jgi:hypothetical protein
MLISRIMRGPRGAIWMQAGTSGYFRWEEWMEGSLLLREDGIIVRQTARDKRGRRDNRVRPLVDYHLAESSPA